MPSPHKVLKFQRKYQPRFYTNSYLEIVSSLRLTTLLSKNASLDYKGGNTIKQVLKIGTSSPETTGLTYKSFHSEEMLVRQALISKGNSSQYNSFHINYIMYTILTRLVQFIQYLLSINKTQIVSERII